MTTHKKALTLALTEFENEKAGLEKVGVTDHNLNNVITAIKEALAQPEQEPVAWRNAAIRVGEDLCSVGPFGYYDMTAEQWLDWALSVVTVHATPPQEQRSCDMRTWVGLTDEETAELVHRYAFYELTRQIEAKLKEKNT